LVSLVTAISADTVRGIVIVIFIASLLVVGEGVVARFFAPTRQASAGSSAGSIAKIAWQGCGVVARILLAAEFCRDFKGLGGAALKILDAARTRQS
jgi:hypothetical protein